MKSEKLTNSKTMKNLIKSFIIILCLIYSGLFYSTRIINAPSFIPKDEIYSTWTFYEYDYKDYTFEAYENLLDIAQDPGVVGLMYRYRTIYVFGEQFSEHEYINLYYLSILSMILAGIVIISILEFKKEIIQTTFIISILFTLNYFISDSKKSKLRNMAMLSNQNTKLYELKDKIQEIDSKATIAMEIAESN